MGTQTMSITHQLMDRRLSGVLLHPTSLPSQTLDASYIGDLGPASRRFTDWLHAAGFGLWQMLPIGPVGLGNSPYSSQSSFAIEPMLISIKDLVDEQFLPSSVLNVPVKERMSRTDQCDWRKARAFKNPRLEMAFNQFSRKRSGRAAFTRFQKNHSEWLGPWCTWISERSQGTFEFHAFVQYVLNRQWQRMRNYAQKRKVALVGDLPIFCGAQSADVAADPQLFRLDSHGKPTVVTGVPPDSFSRDGQLWGHPHYRWNEHRKDGYRWWCNRVRTTLERFDRLRIDHFVGFVHAYEISADAKNARNGRWGSTPGREILAALKTTLGPLPFIAEDLGNVTPKVQTLRKDFGLPGMRILQWAFGSPDSRDLPKHHPLDSVVYPGTHDNDTIAGWWRSLPNRPRQRFETLTGMTGKMAPRAMTELAIESPAHTAIIQAQDLLGLGRSARMNTPGIPTGNWRWRLQRGQLDRALARKIYRKNSEADRLP